MTNKEITAITGINPPKRWTNRISLITSMTQGSIEFDCRPALECFARFIKETVPEGLGEGFARESVLLILAGYLSQEIPQFIKVSLRDLEQEIA